MTELISQWTFLGDDWITAVDIIPERYILAGSRDGHFYVLTWYGVELKRERFENWIGAIRVADVVLAEDPAGELLCAYVVIGNKAGALRCLRVMISSGDQVELDEIFFYQAGNTIRDVDVLRSGGDNKTIWIAAGSEDRHIHLFAFADISTGRPEEEQHLRTNGWIRSVAFCRDPTGTRFLVAGGCGDKYLYLFELTGREVARVFVDSKIHAVISDQRSSLLFCTSDAKKLYLIGPTRNRTFQIQDERSLPHRAIHLEFSGVDCETILIVCEDQHVYVFDVTERELVNRFRLRSRVAAIRTIGQRTNMMLLGLARRSLECVGYRSGTGPIPFEPTTFIGEVGDFKPDDFSRLAELYFVGPKYMRVRVGIGRFLHLIAPFPGAPSACAVATDEGDVDILALDTANQLKRLVHIPRDEVYRVWAVYAGWTQIDRMRVVVATSEPALRTYEVLFTKGEATPALLGKIALDDWPREIRPFDVESTGDEKALVIACENGDLIVHPQPEFKTNVGQILRTAFALMRNGELHFLTGSDNNRISLFRTAEILWSYPTFDRVREVVANRNEMIAVSEDRFLYVLEPGGELIFRYRFPHRALSVDIYQPDPQNRWYVVGCGDGYVYFVNQYGFIGEAYVFPDRIRDVKVNSVGEWLVVACEDLHVYTAPSLSGFLRNQYGTKHDQIISERVRILERAVKLDGPAVLEELSIYERLLILTNFRLWFRTGSKDLLVSLLDSVSQTLSVEDNLKLIYTYAEILVAVAATIDFGIGRSRIVKFIKDSDSDPYALHSLLAAIAHLEVHRIRPLAGSVGGKAVVEVVTSLASVGDFWVMEELLSKLQGAGFLSLAAGGFQRSFEIVPLPYRTFEKISQALTASELIGVRDSDLARFVRNLHSLPAGSRADEASASILREVELVEPEFRAEVVRVIGLYTEAGVVSRDLLMSVMEHWIRRDTVENVLLEILETNAIEGQPLNLLRNCRAVELTFVRDNPLLTGREYLFLSLIVRLAKNLDTSSTSDHDA